LTLQKRECQNDEIVSHSSPNQREHAGHIPASEISSRGGYSNAVHINIIRSYSPISSGNPFFSAEALSIILHTKGTGPLGGHDTGPGRGERVDTKFRRFIAPTFSFSFFSFPLFLHEGIIVIPADFPRWAFIGLFDGEGRTLISREPHSDSIIAHGWRVRRRGPTQSTKIIFPFLFRAPEMGVGADRLNRWGRVECHGASSTQTKFSPPMAK
jgi:hypothetical protein